MQIFKHDLPDSDFESFKKFVGRRCELTRKIRDSMYGVASFMVVAAFLASSPLCAVLSCLPIEAILMLNTICPAQEAFFKAIKDMPTTKLLT